jgi:hypothetical protein
VLRPVSGSKARLTKSRLTRVQTAQLASLLDDLEAAFKRHVIFGSEHYARVLAVYIVADYCRETDGSFLFPFWLYIYLRSRGTGHAKSRVLKIAYKLVIDSSGIMISPSEPALLRATATGRMLLWDETPNSMGGADRELKRSLLNSGNEQGGEVARVDPMTNELRKWPAFGPKMLAGRDIVRDLPDDVLRRTYVIDAIHEPFARLKLAGPAWMPAEFETSIAAPLRARLSAWTAKALPVLRATAASRADVPDELPDDMAESWGPLLAIASLAGRAWKGYVTAAALADVPDQTLEAMVNGHSAFMAELRAAMTRRGPFYKFADYRNRAKRPGCLASKPNNLTARSFGWAQNASDIETIGSLYHEGSTYELRIRYEDFPRLVRLVSKSAGREFEVKPVLRDLRDVTPKLLKPDAPDQYQASSRVWAAQVIKRPTIRVDITSWFAPDDTPTV